MSASDDNKIIEHLISRFYLENTLPHKIILNGSLAFRTQLCSYTSGHYFSCPTAHEKLGRYNDPEKEFGVWYGAEHPASALAETFGRLVTAHRKTMGVVINVTDLEARNMCLVEAVRDLRLLDIRLALSKLRCTVDEITGPDYALTHEIVRVVSRLSAPGYDGIAYESRHHPDGQSCYALWTAPGEAPTVRTVSMTKLSTFEFRDLSSNAVQDTEEILTETLGYSVVSN